MAGISDPMCEYSLQLDYVDTHASQITTWFGSMSRCNTEQGICHSEVDKQGECKAQRKNELS